MTAFQPTDEELAAWDAYNTDALPDSEQSPTYLLIRSVFISGFQAGKDAR